MKIKQGYCEICEKECAAIGNFRTGNFILTCLLLLVLFAPLVLIPIIFSWTFYEYHCPHCGRVIDKERAPENRELAKKNRERSEKNREFMDNIAKYICWIYGTIAFIAFVYAIAYLQGLTL